MKTCQSFLLFWHSIFINSGLKVFVQVKKCRFLNTPMILVITPNSFTSSLTTTVVPSFFPTFQYIKDLKEQYNDNLYTLCVDWTFPLSILGCFLCIYTCTHIYFQMVLRKKKLQRWKFTNKFFRMHHLRTSTFFYKMTVTFYLSILTIILYSQISSLYSKFSNYLKNVFHVVDSTAYTNLPNQHGIKSH